MENKSDNPVDTLLDAALISYADVEPLNGLEDRILDRVIRANSETHYRFVRPLLALGATLALSCWLVFSFQHNRSQSQSNVLAIAHVESHFPMPEPLKSSRPALPFRPIRMKQLPPSPQLPKREMFPMPQPLNNEERALLRFVERDPKEAAQAFASIERQMDAPLEIEPLEIKPLQTDTVSN